MLTTTSQATAYLIAEWASGNSGDAAEIQAVKDAIAAYPDDGEAAPLPGFDETLLFVAKTEDVDEFLGSSEQEINWTAPNGDLSFWVLTKWGQGQADFDTALHLVTPGNTLIYNPGGEGNPPGGLSHIIIWHDSGETTVPDGGMTAAMLGLGVLGLAAIRRKS